MITRFFLSIMVCCLLAVCPVPGVADGAPSLTAEETKQVRLLLVDFRKPRITDERRAKIFSKIVAMGPAAVAELKKMLDKQLAALGESAGKLTGNSAFDEEIGKLRKVMAELRSDPELTEEKIVKVGRPAFERLNLLATTQWREEQSLDEKRARLRGSLENMAALLTRLQQKDSGLGASQYLAQISELQTKIAPDPRREEIRRVFAENAKLSGKLDRSTATGLRMLNEMRVTVGLVPLIIDLKLCEAARSHSADMARLGFFAHESPVEGKKTFADRAKLAGTTGSGENIQRGARSSAGALKVWFLSPGHHKNVFGSHARQGLGASGGHWTQMFGR